MTGKFITLEGGEGVGKSTNLTFIKDYLESSGVTVTVTREPGGTPIGEEIREILLSKNNSNLYELTELLLMFAARAQHLEELIKPELQQGNWVLCDRFTDATYAYQGGARKLENEKIAILENLVQNGLKPDCTFLLDAPVGIGMERAASRGELDRFELENKQFFNNVRNAYLALANADQKRFQVINAANPLEQVQTSIQAVLDQLLSDG